MVADSRPGASGNVGLEIASKSPPDGYTIVLSSPVIALSPLLYGKLNYDPWKDLAPIALVGAVRNVLVIHPSVPAKTLKEFIADRAQESRASSTTARAASAPRRISRPNF